MPPIYAIGDVHGQREMLENAFDLIERDEHAGAPVVLVGDFTDRGPDSRGVIDMLLDGIAAGRPWIPLMGNHDRFLLRFLKDPHYADPRMKTPRNWLAPVVGGRATLESYGVDADERRALEDIHADALQAIPPSHIAFFESLDTTHLTDDHVFVHAGIRPGVPLQQQTEDDLIWIRDEFLDDPRDHGRLVVHGHTPTEAPVHCGNHVNVDGGAGYGRPLIPVLLLGREGWTLSSVGRARL
ncbi:metallophosphoesterase [Mesobacterium sp. TK19101]|uniref:Metallophosphoesterase n=1 Tax=Mesobacterium hydrothermale TaxID=3111907 RepID=A0ABU6HFN4_9RHOB|nr:metallophosphoesterase [Mesobacterium sp. TK19101]MEC3861268.1 metallophosphoesterase [Mesobacterium sp. TK19101]